MDGPSQPAGMVCASLTALGVGAWLTLGGKKKLSLEVCLDINSDTIDAASAVGGKALGLAECVKAGARVRVGGHRNRQGNATVPVLVGT